jgi:hypothetical protein
VVLPPPQVHPERHAHDEHNSQRHSLQRPQPPLITTCPSSSRAAASVAAAAAGSHAPVVLIVVHGWAAAAGYSGCMPGTRPSDGPPGNLPAAPAVECLAIVGVELGCVCMCLRQRRAGGGGGGGGARDVKNKRRVGQV